MSLSKTRGEIHTLPNGAFVFQSLQPFITQLINNHTSKSKKGKTISKEGGL